VTRSNSSEASSNLLPLMAGLSWAPPLGSGFSLLLQGSVGVIPSASVHVKSQTVQTTASGLSVTDVDADLDYGLAPAWRALAGGEWSVGQRWAYDLGVQVLGASFGDAGGTANVNVTDETGTVQPGFPATVTVAPQPFSVTSLSLLAGVHMDF
jgi:hypothetical protein